MTINPEIFMGILIAPLLFREAEEADVLALWKVRKTVFFMVFGLVFATVLVIGYSVHSLVPEIPLAACFCLGAALGPTDAVAVSTVSDRIVIGDRIMAILKGEFLINDASGVISFNFAALALLTGTFSLLDAGLRFLALCAGGLVVGYVVGVAKGFFVRSLKQASIRSAAAYMLIEILTPFLSFFLAEALELSGILAAVAAGSRQAFRINRVEKFEAEFAVFKKSMWEMLTVIFNSFIFILLGLQLPFIIQSVADSPAYTVGFALKIGLFATAVLFAVRFAGAVFGAHDLNAGGSRKEKLRGWLILTLSGVKGTVSLATAFSLPLFVAGGAAFAHRDILLLITACAIIYSLVVATGLLPFIASPKAEAKKNELYISVIRDTIPHTEESGSVCAGAVSIHLKRRARELAIEDCGAAERRLYRRLRKEFAAVDLRLTEKALRRGEITPEDGRAYRRLLSVMAGVQEGKHLRQLRFIAVSIREFMRKTTRPESPEPDTEGTSPVVSGVYITTRHPSQADSPIGDTDPDDSPTATDVGADSVFSPPTPDESRRLQEIFWAHTGRVGGILSRKHTQSKPLLLLVMEERIDIAASVLNRAFEDTLAQQLHEEYDRELKRCFDVERQILNEYLRDGRIREDEADEIRVEINTLETFAIRDVNNDVAMKLILNRAKRSRNVIRRRLGKIQDTRKK
jgi:CPA1 family monovalent cation:H+ antiporter